MDVVASSLPFLLLHYSKFESAGSTKIHFDFINYEHNNQQSATPSSYHPAYCLTTVRVYVFSYCTVLNFILLVIISLLTIHRYATTAY
jgi:hypothetical protein